MAAARTPTGYEPNVSTAVENTRSPPMAAPAGACADQPSASAAAAAAAEMFAIFSPREAPAGAGAAGYVTDPGSPPDWQRPLRSDLRLPGATHSLRSELDLLEQRLANARLATVPRGGTPRPHDGADSGEPSPEVAPPSPPTPPSGPLYVPANIASLGLVTPARPSQPAPSDDDQAAQRQCAQLRAQLA